MGDPPRGCGWCRGCGCAVHIKGWRAGEGLTCPWEPSRGPRAGGVAPRAACLWPKFGPGSRRPAPGGLFLRPSSPAARGGAPALSRGLRREPPSGLDRTLPLRTHWRRGSAAGRSVSPEVRPRVGVRGPLSFAPLSWLESATSLHCSASPLSMPPNPLAG